MSETKPTRKVKASKASPVLKTYRIPAELLGRIATASAATGLKNADIVRLSIDRGIDALVAQLSAETREVAQ